jgi:hypothetical protein
VRDVKRGEVVLDAVDHRREQRTSRPRLHAGMADLVDTAGHIHSFVHFTPPQGHDTILAEDDVVYNYFLSRGMS